MLALKGSLWLVLVLASASCRPKAPEAVELPLDLRASDDTERAVEGVRFWLDGHALGTSGVDGRLQATASGSVGERVSLTAACPPAYRTLQPERELTLARLTKAPALTLVTRCQPLLRQVALIVSTSGARGARLPVSVDGRPVGQLDADGTAHVLLGVEPYSGLRVSLDTSAHASLEPKSPVRVFRLDDQDSILLFDQTFARKQSRRRARPRSSPPPARPYRLH